MKSIGNAMASPSSTSRQTIRWRLLWVGLCSKLSGMTAAAAAAAAATVRFSI